jgi:hypothetical protein
MQDRPLRRQLNTTFGSDEKRSFVSDGEKRWHARALQLEVALTELLDELETGGMGFVCGDARRVLEESP